MSLHDWNYSLYNAYGSGTFVPSYSANGAYVMAGSGGHGNPCISDAIVFDFATATWSLLKNANGVANRATDYQESETNGAPWFEVSGTTVPACTHPYRSLVYLPPSLGGGAKGSVMYVTRGAVTTNARLSTATSKFDLSTRTWSRVNDGSGLSLIAAEESIAFDSATNRYYLVRHNLDAYNTLPYLRASDMSWQYTASFPYPKDWGVNSGWGSAFIHPGERLLINHQGVAGMRALQLDNPSAGWTVLNISGPLPASDGNVWVYYPPDGRFYWRGDTAPTNVIYRLTPPSSSSLTNTWVVDTITLSGNTIPDADATGGQVDHKTRLFFVPSIQSIAWIAGGSQNVVIFKPPLN